MANPSASLTELKTSVQVTGRSDLMPSINWRAATNWQGDPYMIANGLEFTEICTGVIKWAAGDYTAATLDVDDDSVNGNMSKIRLIILSADTTDDFDGSWTETQCMFYLTQAAGSAGYDIMCTAAGLSGGDTDRINFNDLFVWTGHHDENTAITITPTTHSANEGMLRLYYLIVGAPA